MSLINASPTFSPQRRGTGIQFFDQVQARSFPVCPHLNVTSFYRETQVWDSISRVTTTMLQKEFYF